MTIFVCSTLIQMWFVDELREMLGGIGRTTAYSLLKSGRIESVKIGRVYLIPKINVIRFLYESEK